MTSDSDIVELLSFESLNFDTILLVVFAELPDIYCRVSLPLLLTGVLLTGVFLGVGVEAALRVAVGNSFGVTVGVALRVKVGDGVEGIVGVVAGPEADEGSGVVDNTGGV